MRFAELMLLESHNYPLAPYYRTDHNGRRCALGLVEGDQNHRMAERIYPWIARTAANLPCECKRAYCNYPVIEGSGPAGSIIVHLFNEHVMQGGRQQSQSECSKEPCSPWTMEQLADWINSVDPTPPENPENPIPEEEPVRKEESLPVAVTV